MPERVPENRNTLNTQNMDIMRPLQQTRKHTPRISPNKRRGCLFFQCTSGGGAY